MANVLLGWGLGHGIGYAARLRDVARELHGRGHAPVVAVRDVQRTGHLFAREPFPVVPAPFIEGAIRPRGAPFHPTGLVDLMAANGFQDRHILTALLCGWRGLLDVVRPSLVVAEYAPVLWLAAMGRVPRLVLSHGYTVPPIHEGTVARLWGGPRYAIDEEILRVVQEVTDALGTATPRSIGEIVGGEARCILTVAELDPYRSCRREPVLGPLEHLPESAAAPSENAYAYLAGDSRHLDAILGGLVASDLGGRVYVRDDRRDLASRRLSGSRWTPLNAPPPLPDIVSWAGVVISHGAINTVQAALGAGRPQLLLPSKLDQTHVALAAAREGFAEVLHGQPDSVDVKRSLRRLRWDRSYQRAAVEVASAIRARGEHGSLGRVVELCDRMIRAA